MDFTKLYCRVHPQELVTNYCVKCSYVGYGRGVSNLAMCQLYM